MSHGGGGRVVGVVLSGLPAELASGDGLSGFLSSVPGAESARFLAEPPAGRYHPAAVVLFSDATRAEAFAQHMRAAPVRGVGGAAVAADLSLDPDRFFAPPTRSAPDPATAASPFPSYSFGHGGATAPGAAPPAPDKWGGSESREAGFGPREFPAAFPGVAMPSASGAAAASAGIWAESAGGDPFSTATAALGMGGGAEWGAPLAPGVDASSGGFAPPAASGGFPGFPSGPFPAASGFDPAGPPAMMPAWGLPGPEHGADAWAHAHGGAPHFAPPHGVYGGAAPGFAMPMGAMPFGYAPHMGGFGRGAMRGAPAMRGRGRGRGGGLGPRGVPDHTWTVRGRGRGHRDAPPATLSPGAGLVGASPALSGVASGSVVAGGDGGGGGVPGGGGGAAPSGRVLHVSVYQAKFPVTVFVLRTIFSRYGNVLRAILFTPGSRREKRERRAPVKSVLSALIEMETAEGAAEARRQLDNRCMYEGCNVLRVQMSKQTSLSVRYHNEKSADWTRDDLPAGPPFPLPGTKGGIMRSTVPDLEGSRTGGGSGGGVFFCVP